ncbi:ATP-dependent helicase HrpB [Algiphilus sp.]|uniref:ATP-dependent helicase HrpB n=1 Tax=Algiphilus sp. TaxID=1872431 RepID=UPI003B529B18
MTAVRLAEAQSRLPVAEVAEAVCAAVAQGGAVLCAPPGSGKTTLIPLLLRSLLASGERIIVVTPRQVAARAAARRMAELVGEAVGEQVGYQVRWDRQCSARTQIVVMTEGVLLRRLAQDPELREVRCVVLDEFHERSADADTLLGMLLDVRDSLRPDLGLLVMSATLQAEPVAELLGGVEIIHAEGRMYPVEIEHQSLPASPVTEWRAFADGVARAVHDSCAQRDGDVLVFLPGMREIRAVADRLAAVPAELHVLHSSVRAEDQDAALRPASQRKVILATPIAQTSVTVEGVRTVIDSGWHRLARFDPGAGSDRLVTERVSRAAADQRAGRAGRVESGHCLRLWSTDQHARLPAFDTPEVLRADLSAFVLRAECWGRGMARALRLLDPPPDVAVQRAESLLQRLGALDTETAAVTPLGQAMNALPLGVRTAAMLLRAEGSTSRQCAIWLAALLDTDQLGDEPLERRWAQLASLPAHAPVRRVARDLAQALQTRLDGAPARVDPEQLAPLIASAFPERVAQRRHADSSRFLCADGGEVEVDAAQVGTAEWAAVAHWLPGTPRQARLAVPLARADVEAGHCGRLVEVEYLGWDTARGAVVGEYRTQLGAIIVSRRSMARLPPAPTAELLLEWVADQGLAVLPWSDTARDLQARIGSLRAWRGGDWPALDDASLSGDLDEWLAPWLAGMTRASDLRTLDMEQLIRSAVDAHQWPALERLAPAVLQVPTGHRIRLQYSGDAEPPVLAVKLQALFGMSTHPTVNDGAVPVRIHLLSPAGRPLQITQDLASFWQNGYREVAKDLRGRYPKHPWPEDPLATQASMHTKRRGTA